MRLSNGEVLLAGLDSKTGQVPDAQLPRLCQRRGGAVFQRYCAIQHCKVEINHRRTILCVVSTPNP